MSGDVADLQTRSEMVSVTVPGLIETVSPVLEAITGSELANRQPPLPENLTCTTLLLEKLVPEMVTI